MLIDLFNAIGRQAQDAAVAKLQHRFLEVPNSNGRERLLISPDGTAVTVTSSAPPEAVEIRSVVDFCRYVQNYNQNAIVFYGEQGLFAWLDMDKRLDSVWCPLLKTPLFRRLEAIEVAGGRDGDQREIYNLLRVDFGKFLVDQAFYSWVRRCKWKSGAMADRSVGVGSDSFGRDAELAVASEDGSTCPESFKLRVRVFDEPTIADDAVIDMAVDVKLQSQRFTVAPFPGELKRIVDRELGAIEAYVKDQLPPQDIPFYRGLPRVGVAPEQIGREIAKGW